MHKLLRDLIQKIDDFGAAGGLVQFTTLIPSFVDIAFSSQNIICSDGSDGDIVLDGGEGIIPGFDKSGSGSSAIYTMTNHLTCSNLTISSGIELKPAGYLFRVRENMTLGDNCKITANGANGSGASLGAGSTGNYYGGGTSGGTGRTDNGIDGGNATSFTSPYVYLGGNGGAGGNGASGNTGGTSVTTNKWAETNGDKFYALLHSFAVNSVTELTKLAGGMGGGGGGGHNVASSIDISGGGGGGGGVIVIMVGGKITYGTGCSIEAKGGNGANATTETTANLGGGGGAGGGCVIVRSKVKAGSVTITVTGGTAGTKTGTGTDGTAGVDGFSREVYFVG